MSVQLRDYQDDMIERGRAAMRKHRRVLFQSPTGSGKTAIASYMAEEASRRGRVDFICHRRELVQQTHLTFQKYGLPHGFVAADWPVVPGASVQIASVDTLKNRYALLGAPRLALWDECHHMGAAGWQRIMDAWGCYHVGLSATPRRLDGVCLSRWFDDIVLGPEVAWLIEQGHLSDYQIFAPPAPDGIKATGMDDGRGEQAKVMDKPKIVGDIVGHWLKLANGLRTVGFACNVEHSKHMAAAFRAAGIPSEHLDGTMPRAERDRIIREYAAGRITVLWNVSLFGEGFDLAAIAQMDVTIDCVILARKTQSLSLYLQMVGRALRPYPGKVAVINDHAGNFHMHGYPDDARDWSFDGGREGAGESAANETLVRPPMTCKGCFKGIRYVNGALPLLCPHCDKALPVPTVRGIEVVEGELEEATPEGRRQARMERQHEERLAADSGLGALVALGRRRGYPSPQQWAIRRLAAHMAKQRAAA